MKQFILVLVDGNTRHTTGYNIVDALWRSGSTQSELKRVAAYQEGVGPVIRFAH